jgi:hypothetical protein
MASRMLISTVLLLAASACGTTSFDELFTPGVATAAGGAGGTARADASTSAGGSGGNRRYDGGSAGGTTGSGGGATGDGGATGTGGGRLSDGGASCENLGAELSSLLAAAQICTGSAQGECATTVQGVCCPVPVASTTSDGTAAYLDALAQYSAHCRTVCPDIPCRLGGGTCAAVSGSDTLRCLASGITPY